jgi:Zn-dependent M28 family amino/carboxypeptidase
MSRKKRTSPGSAARPSGPGAGSGLWKKRAVWMAALAGGVALVAWGALSLTQQHSPAQSGEIGDAAYEHVKSLVAMGPRPSGSITHGRMRQYVARHLQSAGFTVEEDSFTADTPIGSVPMTNLIGRIGGREGGRILMLGAHYETAKVPDFVGANDGGSGTGLLLALAPLLAARKLSHEVRLVFFDGEEAFQQWSESDSLYGSRHLADQWKADGTLSRIGAFILVDMIGDADLDVLKDGNSTPWLRDVVWRTAQRLGHSNYFLDRETSYEDDHLPFVRAGVPAVDLLDLNYGPNHCPNGCYWHSPEDTLDKVSAASLQVVGEVVLESLVELDRQQ